MDIEPKEPSTVIPDGAYGLIFHEDQQVEMITPTDPETDGFTDGHLLLLGIVMLLKQPGWGDQLINEVGQQLLETKKDAGNNAK